MTELAQRFRKVERALHELFGATGRTVRIVAPGRVNLIGEHTDYNDGFVFPCAIDKSIIGAFQVRTDDNVVLHSLNFGTTVGFSLKNIHKDDADRWGNYPKAIAHTLLKHGYEPRGIEGVIESDLPVGSGLASSAAIEMLVVKAFATLSRLKLDLTTMIKLAQEAENRFVGVRCGIMDQFAIGRGKKDHAIMLDCRSLEYQYARLPLAHCRIVIGNTRKARGLTGSKYNQRRAECEAAVKLFHGFLQRPIAALRDVSVAEFEAHHEKLPQPIRARARHVIEENDRVQRSVAVLRGGGHNALKQFGNLITESHQSLRDLYEVSCFELDTMVDLSLACPGVIGARMTGAGFGGCMVALIETGAVQRYVNTIGTEYEKRTKLTPEFYVCTISDGVHVVR